MTKPFHILFDHQIFELQSAGGISRYFSDLFTEWNNQNSLQYTLSIQYSDNIYLKEHYLKANTEDIPKRLHDNNLHYLSPLSKLNPEIYRMAFDYLYFRNEKIKKCQNQTATIELLKDNYYDLFHPTYFDDYFLPYLNGKPYVLTVYDLIEEIFPEYFMVPGSSIRKRSEVIKKASHIIAISENTKRDLINIYNISPEKISTIYLGYRPKYFESSHLPKIPEKFFLYIGQRHLYKNFYFTVEAIQPLLETYQEIMILCIGGPKFTNEELTFFERLNLENRVLWIDASDGLLSYCYQHAIALIYTSMYEGFGIPIIEAFYEGCPIIGTNVSSIPEIGKNAIAYVSPKDPISMREVTKKIITNAQYRQELIVRGKKIATEFSWKHAAEQTKEVYKRVLE